MNRIRLHLSAVLLAMAGCAAPHHLVLHQNTVLGIDAATTAESGNVRLTVGYDRQTTAFVPKTETEINGVQQNEAMSTVSLSTLKIHGIGQYEVHEQFATGAAALNVAADPNGVQNLRSK